MAPAVNGGQVRQFILMAATVRAPTSSAGTLTSRSQDVLAHFDRALTSNGPTEVVNEHLEHRPGPAQPHPLLQPQPHPNRTPQRPPDSNHPNPTMSPTYHTLKHEQPLKSPLIKTLRQVATRQNWLAVGLGPQRVVLIHHRLLLEPKKIPQVRIVERRGGCGSHTLADEHPR